MSLIFCGDGRARGHAAALVPAAPLRRTAAAASAVTGQSGCGGRGGDGPGQ